MLNSITLVGRLVKDPETFTTKDGVLIVNFALAFNQGINEDGSEDTGFIDCKAFKTVAQVTSEHLAKGDKIAILGTLNQRKFERKDGSKGSTFEILVNSLEFIDVLKFNQPQEVKEEPKPVAKASRPRR